jgi:hypothetical protein
MTVTLFCGIPFAGRNAAGEPNLPGPAGTIRRGVMLVTVAGLRGIHFFAEKNLISARLKIAGKNQLFCFFSCS